MGVEEVNEQWGAIPNGCNELRTEVKVKGRYGGGRGGEFMGARGKLPKEREGETKDDGGKVRFKEHTILDLKK